MVFDDIYLKAEELMKLLKKAGLSISFAESLTGGMVASRLVDVPGSSEVLKGGVVSYTNEIKINVLGVSAATIKKHTEVSEECAEEMAKGVRKLTSSDISFSATGYAGDYEMSSDEMNGTVCFGFSYEDKCDTFTQHFEGLRDEVRKASVEFIYDTVISYLKEKYE